MPQILAKRFAPRKILCAARTVFKFSYGIDFPENLLCRPLLPLPIVLSLKFAPRGVTAANMALCKIDTEHASHFAIQIFVHVFETFGDVFMYRRFTDPEMGGTIAHGTTRLRYVFSARTRTPEHIFPHSTIPPLFRSGIYYVGFWRFMTELSHLLNAGSASKLFSEQTAQALCGFRRVRFASKCRQSEIPLPVFAESATGCSYDVCLFQR